MAEACREYLAEINPQTGRTNAEEVARNIIEIAIGGGPNSVRAAIEIRRATESGTADESGAPIRDLNIAGIERLQELARRQSDVRSASE